LLAVGLYVQCLAGWPGSEANSIAIIERNPSLLSIAPNPVFSGSSRRQLGDIRLTTVNTWTNVAARFVRLCLCGVWCVVCVWCVSPAATLCLTTYVR